MSFSSEFAHSRQEDGKVVRQKGFPLGDAFLARTRVAWGRYYLLVMLYFNQRMSTATANEIVRVVIVSAHGTMHVAVCQTGQHYDVWRAIQMKYRIPLVVRLNMLLKPCHTAVCFFAYDLAVGLFNVQINGVSPVQVTLGRRQGSGVI